MGKLLVGLLVGAITISVVGCNSTDVVVNTDTEVVEEKSDVEPEKVREDKVVDEALTETTVIDDALISNSINSGYTYYYNGLTYYSREDGIYTLDKDYNRNKLIDSSYPRGINVVNDEIIFSIRTNTDYMSGASAIYKANIDGTNLELIKEIENGFVYNLMVIDDRIYYTRDINQAESESLMFDVKNLYSVDLSGGNEEYIIKCNYGTWIGDYFILNNEIYFTQTESIDEDGFLVEKSSLQKMNMDTKAVTVLLDNIEGKINYKNGNVYFTYEEEVSNLYTYALDTGVVNKIISDDENFNINNSINFTDSFIYYTDLESVYRVGFDGSNKTNCGESMKSVGTLFASDKSIWGYGKWNMHTNDKAQIAIYAE